MMKPALSAAAAGLLRALVRRGGTERHRILLSGVRSTEWHSLTFSGERHWIELRVPGDAAKTIADRMAAGIAEAEFAIAGHVVADIAVAAGPLPQADGSVLLAFEALTVSD